MCLLSAVSRGLVLVGEAYFTPANSKERLKNRSSEIRLHLVIKIWGYSTFHLPKRMVAKAAHAFLSGFILSYNKQSGPGLTGKNNYSFWTSISLYFICSFVCFHVSSFAPLTFLCVRPSTTNYSQSFHANLQGYSRHAWLAHFIFRETWI